MRATSSTPLVILAASRSGIRATSITPVFAATSRFVSPDPSPTKAAACTVPARCVWVWVAAVPMRTVPDSSAAAPAWPM